MHPSSIWLAPSFQTRLGTPKHFPFKPHLPHPHIALSALLNKQSTEHLTTNQCSVFPVGLSAVSSNLLPFANLCPPLAQIQHGCPEQAARLHFSSLMDKTNSNTFLLFLSLHEVILTGARHMMSPDGQFSQ